MIVKKQGITMPRLPLLLSVLIPLTILTSNLNYAQSHTGNNEKLTASVTLNTMENVTANKKSSTKKSLKVKKHSTKDKIKKQKLKFGSVNINQASAQEMVMTLKGIGKKKAKAIVDYRHKNGPFKKSADLINVKGIGKKLFIKNKKRIRLSGDNTQ